MRAVPLALLLAAALLAFARAAVHAADPPLAPGPAASSSPGPAASSSPAPAPTTTASSPPQIALGLSYILSFGAQRCPSEKVFRDEVAAKMGYDPFTNGVPEAVVITLTRSTRGSTATVEFNDAAHARRWNDKVLPISDNNCVELVYATALYMTLQWLPFPSPLSTAAPSTPPPPSNPPSTPSAEASSPPAPPSPTAAPASPLPAARTTQASRTPGNALPPRTPPVRTRRPNVELGAGLFGVLGMEPSITFGGTFQIGLRWPLWSLGLEARLDAPASKDVEVDMLPTVHVKTSFAGGSVVPCWYPRPPFLLCAVATGGRVEAESADMRNRKRGRGGYLGAGLRGGMQKQLGDHFIVRGYLEILGSVVSLGADLGGARVQRTFPVSGDVGGALLGFW